MRILLTNNAGQRGFTIIETLVAVTVLMIAVAGPLSIASKGLAAAIYARDQMTATFLAQETMETVKNMKDNSWAQTGGSGPTFPPSSIVSCSSSAPCDVSSISGVHISCPTTGCPLVLRSNVGYDNSGSGSATPFKRRVYLDSVDANERRVHVFVTWTQGTVNNEVHLSSQLVRTLR